MKFTDRGIKALKPKADRYEIYDDTKDGFGIRVFPSGTKTFITRYRNAEGKLVKLTIGHYSDDPGGMSLKAARIQHNKYREQINGKVDPRTAEKVRKQRLQEALRQELEADTVESLAKEYLERWAKARKRSWQEDERILNKDILPAWKGRKAKDVTRRDVIKLLDDITDRGAAVVANRTLALISKMFRFGIDRGIVETSPCIAIRMPSEETPRDRVLTDDEIRAFWSKIEEAKTAQEIKLALKLQLVTAQRRGEVAGAEWAEFDLNAGWWTIPAAKAKNKLSHRVPLTQLALDLLAELKALTGEECYLLPSPTKEDEHITERALTRAVANNRDVFGIAPFTPHDLRRTAASHMTGLGIPRLVVSKVLNHVESGITAVYDRHSYDSEKRQALEKWERKLRLLTDQKQESNVIKLPVSG